MMIYSYEEMKIMTKDFYNHLGLEMISDKFINDAIASLTMPQYADIFGKNYKDIKIKDHRALATLGDAVCGSLLLARKYNYDSTPKDLTFEKEKLTNENLNEKGKQLLKENLFSANNDLDEKNTKSYATAFEAVIGFLSLVDLKFAKEVFEKYVN